MRTDGDFSIKTGPFKPDMESLKQFQCPEWFKKAKFGIWAHWGPQSVPMQGDWYAHRMYCPDTDVYKYHVRTYGHPSKAGYKDICARWKAEAFDPDELIDLYIRAGARYFVSQMAHCDNFDNFDSAFQPRFNSVHMGPKKDILRLWRDAARKRGLPFGFSEHLSVSYHWFSANKNCDMEGMYKGVPYDGNDPEYGDLYHEGNNNRFESPLGWSQPERDDVRRNWFLRVKDAIDKYEPDILYSDSCLPCGQYGLNIIAHLYNASAARYGVNNAVYTQKDPNPDVFPVGVLDIERSREETMTGYVWQTDTAVGDWFYSVRDCYKPWHVIVETLVDIISKNGVLLLNVTQKPDGTVDDENRYILGKISGWMAVNGEGVYDTECFRVCGEGTSQYTKRGQFEEYAVNWNETDVRFTRKGNNVYAFLMRAPDRQAVLRTFDITRERVKDVSMLGAGRLPFEQTGAGLVVNMPDTFPSQYVNCLKITV
ncbi:MAG: alpha-L-fucosidase [Oscillospiraceae bacterium]|nr:alpha-L-fucosidase [Oscillospiraceae bacterium]